MCEFFSCIATRDGRLLFTEDNSHETIIARAKLRDTQTCRHFVRLEIAPPFDTCRLDQLSTPGWFEQNSLDYEDRAIELARRIAPARKAYEDAEAPARKAYEEVVATAWKAYEEAKAPAQKVYEEAKATARKAYEEVEATAWKAYEEVEAPARKAYEEAKATARKAYIEFLSGIEGYIPEL